MTSKELDNQLYGIDCDFEMIDSDISILVEQLRHDRREMAKVTEELKGDRILYASLKDVVYELDKAVGTLRNYLLRYRDVRSDIEDKVELSRRIVKGGIKNESE